MKNTREANGRKQNLRIKTEQNCRNTAGEKKRKENSIKRKKNMKLKKINETILEEKQIQIERTPKLDIIFYPSTCLFGFNFESEPFFHLEVLAIKAVSWFRLSVIKFKM